MSTFMRTIEIHGPQAPPLAEQYDDASMTLADGGMAPPMDGGAAGAPAGGMGAGASAGDGDPAAGGAAGGDRDGGIGPTDAPPEKSSSAISGSCGCEVPFARGERTPLLAWASLCALLVLRRRRRFR